jgi:hypothetical protein
MALIRNRAPRVQVPRVAVALALAVGGLSACGEDPFAIDWVSIPDTVVLYSLARPELNLVSAFNFRGRSAVRVEAASTTPGSWDVAVDTRGGAIVLLPPAALGISDSRARIAPITGVPFADLLEAPADTTVYLSTEPVPATLGTVYVIRTEQSTGAFGTRCVYYAKLEPLTIDPVAGTLRFQFDVSPVCNDRRLVPPEDT